MESQFTETEEIQPEENHIDQIEKSEEWKNVQSFAHLLSSTTGEAVAMDTDEDSSILKNLRRRLSIKKGESLENRKERFPDEFGDSKDFNTNQQTQKDDGQSDHVTITITENIDDSGRLEKNMKSITIYSLIGFVISFICVLLCSGILFKSGSGMPKDYSALWIQTVITTLCASTFIVRPLTIALFTVYKVCVYRFFGYKGFVFFCKPVPLDQAVTVWKYYQKSMQPDLNSTKNLEENLEKLKRERLLRYAHPPPEHEILRLREKILMKKKITTLFRKIFNYFAFMFLLAIIIHDTRKDDIFYLNKALNNSITNGTCLKSNMKDYMSFHNITTSKDWWIWVRSELLDLTYNHDEEYSSDKVFCDTNSLIIGTPRIRTYQVSSTFCSSDHVIIKYNDTFSTSMSNILKVRNCFPDYEDQVNHLYGFPIASQNKYDWDSHYLAIIRGKFSSYSQTNIASLLPKTRIEANMKLFFLEMEHLMRIDSKTRAIITEFTLYHPQSRLYSCVEFIAEFSAISGAQTTVQVSSTLIDKINTYWSYVSKIILVVIAILFTKIISIHLYKIRGKFWVSFWSILNFFSFLVGWCYVVFLMLRVNIVESILWDLKVHNYETFVNLKCLIQLDSILTVLAGIMLTLHILRCLVLLSYFPRMRKLSEVLYLGTKEALKMSFAVLFFLTICAHLGFMWFGHDIYEFCSMIFSLETVLKAMVLRTSFYKEFYAYYGYSSMIAHIFFMITFIVLFFMIFGIYKAIFIYAKKNYVFRRRTIELSWIDILKFLREKKDTFWIILRCKTRKQDDVKTNSHLNASSNLAELSVQTEKLMEKLNKLEEQFKEEDLNYRLNKLLSMTNHLSVDRETISSSVPSNTESYEMLPTSVVSEYISRDEDNNLINETINFAAFDGITSAPSEMESTTIDLLENLTQNVRRMNEAASFNHTDHLSKFLNDVAASNDSSALKNYGKYGKSVLKVNRSKGLLSYINDFNLLDAIHEKSTQKEASTESRSAQEEKVTYFTREKIHFEGIDDLLKEYGLEDSSEELNE